MIPLRKHRQALPILEVARALGLPEPVERSGRLWTRCPRSERHRNNDVHPSLELKPSEDRAFCNVCPFSGDGIGLIKFALACDEKTAFGWARDHGLLSNLRPADGAVQGSRRSPAPMTKERWARALRAMEQPGPHRQWLERFGISADVCRGLVGFEAKHFDGPDAKRPALLFAQLDENGDPMGPYLARFIDDAPDRKKSKLRVRAFLIGGHLARTFERSQPAVVAAGEKDWLVARTLGFQAVGLPGEGTLPKETIDLLRGLAVVFALDADRPGEEAAARHLAAFTAAGVPSRAICWPETWKGNGAKDLTDFVLAGHGRQEIEQLVADASQHIAPPEESKARSGEKVNTPALAAGVCKANWFAVDAGGKLWRYDAGVYRRDGVRHVARAVKVWLAARGQADQWTTYRVNEVVAYIAADAPALWERPPLDRVNLLNGILHVKTGELAPHSPDHLSPVQLPVKFDPEADCPAWVKFCEEVFPADCWKTLPWELAAWLMLPITSIQKAVLLIGAGNNGKSCFLTALAAFLGRANVAARTLHSLESNRFATATLVGKLANIAADLPSRHLTDTSTFKGLTGTEFAIPAEYKHGAQFDFNCFARLVFSANHPPTANDASEAFFRRWLVVPFDRQFGGEDGAKEILRPILDARLADPRELSGVLNRALRALPKVLTDGISETPTMRAAWDELREQTDPVSVFMDSHTVYAPDAMVTKDELLATYNAAARREGRAPFSRTAFGLAVKRARGDLQEANRTVAGRRQWVWLGIGVRGQGSE